MAAGDGWRYMAQRFDGSNGGLGDFLDLNVPLQGVDINEVLSGHNGLSGTISPEYPRLKGPDGRPILIEGGSAIWAEDPDGEIRGGGLLTFSDFNADGSWGIECTDLTFASVGLPFMGANWFVNVDPIDCFRFIWQHIQQQRSSNFGMSITPNVASPIRLGTDLVQTIDFDTEPDVSAGLEDLEPAPAPIAPPRYATNALWRDAGVKAMKATGWKPGVVDDALKKWLNKDSLTEQKKWEPLTQKERTIRDSTIDKIGWPPNPPNPGNKSITGIIYVRPQINPPEGGEVITPEEVGEDGGDDPKPVYQYDAYKLNWYETLDLGAEIDKLASETPFDWHKVASWTPDDEIAHHIRVGYPKLGRRRSDLRFVVGENVKQPPSVERDGTTYATEVMVLGAGEGSAVITGHAFRPDDNRVRRVITVSDPSIKTVEDANRRAEAELAKFFVLDDITDVIVEDHPHAPLGSIDLGDEIYVEGDIGWLEIDAWCRVVARSIRPDSGDSQILTVIRSERIA